MKTKIISVLLAGVLLVSCNKDKAIADTLSEYNLSMETKGYHFGDKINFP